MAKVIVPSNFINNSPGKSGNAQMPKSGSVSAKGIKAAAKRIASGRGTGTGGGR